MIAGCPQGTLLGCILYILYINPIAFPGEITIQVEETLTRYWEKLDKDINLVLDENLYLPDTVQSVKYMDDATVQESLDISTALSLDNITGRKVLLPTSSLLQTEINTLKHISDTREMRLNCAKTKIFITNFTKNNQFESHLTIPGQQEPIQVTSETKLLGYWLTTDMKTETHVNYIVSKCYKRLWAVRKLKNAGVSVEDIIKFYSMKIRSVLESSCPVFHSMLTTEDSNNIERIQKITLRILLGPNYESYDSACQKLNIDSLKTRRENLSLNYALKLLDCPQGKNFFCFTEKKNIFLRKQPLLQTPLAHTNRYKNSPLPYLTRLLNQFFEKKIEERDYINIPSKYFPLINMNNGL